MAKTVKDGILIADTETKNIMTKMTGMTGASLRLWKRKRKKWRRNMIAHLWITKCLMGASRRGILLSWTIFIMRKSGVQAIVADEERLVRQTRCNL